MELTFGLEMQIWNIPKDRVQRVEGKMSSFVYLLYWLSKLWSLKCQKWLIFFTFYQCQQKISHSWDKIFMCIFWISLFSSLRKYYELLHSELPLARHQPMKIESFLIFLLIQQFFDMSTLDMSQAVTPKSMNHTIFWKKSKRSFRFTV